MKHLPEAAVDNPNFVTSLAKGLEILSAFGEGDMLGNQELVERTGMPKATVSRMTSTLAILGYLRIDPQSRKFLMGSRLLGMGANVQRMIGVQPIARPFMAALSTDVDLTVSMASRDRLGMVVLEVIRPPWRSQLVANIDVGTVLPLPTTSLGLAYIVAAPVKERTQILAALRRRDPADWPRLREGIERAHAEYARNGFVLTQRSWGRDVNGVGVPLALEESKTLYAFHCAGPVARMPVSRLRQELGPKLVRMVQDIRAVVQSTPRAQLKPPQIHQP